MHKRMMATMLIAAAPFAAGTHGFAQTPTTNTGFYGGLGAGAGRTDLNHSGITGSTDKKDGVWKLFGGYQINRNIAVEGGYVDMGKASVAGSQGFASAESNAWQIGAVGSLPLSQQFALTGKLGVARTSTDSNGSVNGVAFGNTQHNTAPTYGLGMRYDLSQTVALRGDWDRYRIQSGAFGGKSDSDLFTVGAQFKF
jgi:OOP family OmpA-OmpF porin